jgi:succinoglycan biosynthesis transport protein ExoP
LHATLDDKRDMNRRTTDWLRERLSDLKQQAAAAQGAVNAFKASNSLLEGTGQHLIETRFAELNRELAVERSRLSELTARLSRVENVIREYSMAEVKPALSEFMNNALTSKLREQLYELSNRKENWSKKYSNDHEAVRNLQRRINEIHVALLHEHHRLAESYRSDIDISRRKEKLIQTTLDEVSNQLQAAHKARIRLRELESTAQTTQTLYDGLLKRQSEATEQETFPIARGRVLNEAVEPIGKNYRKTLRMAMILAMLGIAFGCAGALLRELSDNTFRSLSDVEQILGAPLLAVVGQWKRGQAPIELSRRSLAQGEIAKGNVARREGFFGRSEREMRKSQVTEAFMMLKHHVEEHVERHGKVVGITSGQPGEGASTIAASLASTMAANGTRTLLIDCDLRNPALSRMLAPAATTGLVDLLRGEAELADVLRIEPVTGLHFIPAASTVGERSIELLSSPAMQALMEAARRDYDCVMVDLASLVPLVDVLKMAPYVDGYVSIVAWGYSQKETTQRAYERLPHFQNRLIGVVLNKVDMARIHHYDYSASQWFDTKRYQNYMTLKSA